ncbi:uncharacterized protein BO87DRAFT_121584 [Aspergillus neoniger CBS 115656]|uniref:Transmembrane protein n=1 Tax=Aspergillus neoniger (strain CBS 115656) TaxID=1448310 RepID=A0A318YBU4_ASPNB|nr:hypothetical protein BO87DRAFT_121584 [Aspergillus neoniger CBS 115656]PYH31845.1 hypothetical protein BO87DRAFT_121584 [Aspergillus neoniger CBS 115656]
MHHLSFVILVTLRDIHLPFGAGRRKFPLEGRFPTRCSRHRYALLTDTSFPVCHAHALFFSLVFVTTCVLFFSLMSVYFPWARVRPLLLFKG